MAFNPNTANPYRMGIHNLKSQFIHPLMEYNFYIVGIPNVKMVNCKGSSIPGKTVSKIPVKFRGRELYYNGTVPKFEDWKVDIQEDITYATRTSLEAWLGVEADNLTGFGMITPAVTKDLEIFMLAPGVDVPVGIYKLINAFPYNLGEINLNQESTESVVNYSCIFSIDAWDRLDMAPLDLSGLPSSVIPE